MVVYLRIRHHQRQCDLARLRKLDRDPRRQLINDRNASNKASQVQRASYDLKTAKAT